MNKLKQVFKRLLSKFGGSIQSELYARELKTIRNATIDANYQLIQNKPRYNEPKRLLSYGYQVLAQSDEDGIIAEIFRRINTTNKYFVEFGVGIGIENNTANLLFQDWRGLWIEGDAEYAQQLREHLSRFINSQQLISHEAFVDENNIEKILEGHNVPKELDLLSIDIDSFDHYIWKAINNFNPRVVVIEYNSSFGPTTEWVMQKNIIPTFTNHTSCFGASLKSYEKLGAEKGYALVGCNVIGVNAFFVRKDLVSDLFAEPFTSENHYEPPRYHMLRQIGHPRDFNIYK